MTALPIDECVTFTVFLSSGVSARQRKIEVEKLNESLRKINMSLRQQARAGIVYAPGLRYAPPSEALDGQGGTAVLEAGVLLSSTIGWSGVV